MTQADSNIRAKSRKSVSRRAALTGAAAKRKRPLRGKELAFLLSSISENADHAFRLVEATWPRAAKTPPLILQAVFRELCIDLRPVCDAAQRLFQRNRGKQ